MSDSNIVKAQIAVYRDSFLEHGDSPRGVRGNDRETQDLRFERLMFHLLEAKPSFSIHDVGAGLCHLHRHLLDRGVEHVYSATEIVQEMVDAAREKYPEIRVHNRDLLREEVADRHDFVVSSGLFFIPGEADRSEWARFTREMALRMWEMADAAISFNFLTSYRSASDPSLHYMDPREVLDFCVRRLSRFVVLDHGYPLFECTATVFKPGFVESRHATEPFRKYFRVTRLDR
jgi:hypothetical protein